jgi:hypothetical protein
MSCRWRRARILPLYITQAEWAAMWKKALQGDEDRIIDIRVPPNEAEAIKYVAKPADYLTLVDGEWYCDIMETLHYGLAHRRMIAWSRWFSDMRRRLGFPRRRRAE